MWHEVSRFAKWHGGQPGGNAMSMRWFVSIALVCASVAWSAESVWAQAVGGLGTKQNLDLPFDAAGDDTPEEDAPEVVIFYNQALEGDGFFYTIDRSGTMQDRGELAIARREVTRNITEFSLRTQFGISFFDANLIRFPSSGRPATATAGMKSAAIAWVNSVAGGAGTCCEKGLLGAIQFANFSSVRRKVIVYVGDGGGTCPGAAAGEPEYLRRTLARVAQRNFQRVQINTIGVLMQGRAMQEDFLRAVAAQNRGTYKRIN